MKFAIIPFIFIAMTLLIASAVVNTISSTTFAQKSELGCHWGGACSALKKLWKSYRIAGRNYGVDSRRDICWKIRNIQNALGIEKTHFEELEGMIDDEESEEGLSVEEVELQREEKEENGGYWNLHFDYRERSDYYG